MRLYIIRHADPDYDNNTITEKGHREAEALAKRLATEGIDRIYCSPMGRALHTMRYTAERIGREATIIDWIQEIAATVEYPGEGTLGAWDAPGEMVYARPLHLDEEGWADFPHLAQADMKRKLSKLRADSDAFLASLGYRREGGRYAVERPSSERIALFCHGGFGLSWLSHLLHIPPIVMWTGFWLPPSSVSTISFERRSPQWATPRCIGLGDVSHLYAAGLPIQRRGIYGDHDWERGDVAANRR